MTNDPTSNDPQDSGLIVEPPNSTVDDWHGQEVDRDFAAADQALKDADGDEAEAAKLFEQNKPEHTSDRFKVPEDERPS